MKVPATGKNLYLVGFMGTGKSAIGRCIARQLSARFIDTDSAIEAQVGRSVAGIFEQCGERHFRDLERQFITSGHPCSGCVVACGGGLITQPGMLDLLRARGLVVCLCASVATILRRTAESKKRPLLDVADRRLQIESLLEKRRLFYQQVQIAVHTDYRSIAEVAAQTLRIYQEYAGSKV